MTFDQWFASICTAPAYVHFLWLDRAMRELEEYLEFSSLSAAEREEYIGTDGDIACGVFVATHLPVFCGKVLWPGLDNMALRKKWYQVYLANTPGDCLKSGFWMLSGIIPVVRSCCRWSINLTAPSSLTRLEQRPHGFAGRLV